MLEAQCPKCGETFNPDDETDLEHIQTIDDITCGGTGVLAGQWGG
jgi:hypothetical protein